MRKYYIGADVHSNFTEIAIEYNGNIILREMVRTTISTILEVLSPLKGEKIMAIEEGTMADWLYRNLKPHVDDFIVSDPRRNRLIASEGDKDDKIDAGKLAQLLRGGYLKRIYHTDDPHRAQFKQWMRIYHDRVHDSVRMINKIRALCRLHGVAIPRQVIRNNEVRTRWMAEHPNDILLGQLQVLWIGLDAATKQVHYAKRVISMYSKTYPIIAAWSDIPGIGIIRAATLFVYLDTPWRFRHKNKLWKYCGVGLQRTTSGTDRWGNANTAKLRLSQMVNRPLKSAICGAAVSVIHDHNNVFKVYYERMRYEGINVSNARHAVARKLLTVIWGMWKSNNPFDQTLVSKA